MGHLEIARHERWIVVTLNRPDRANALSSGLLSELESTLDDAASDPDVRAVVIRGAGRGFSGGYDLTDSKGDTHLDHPNYPSDTTRDVERIRVTAQRWLRIFHAGVPTIAQVHGYCLAGGFELAMACDFVIAAEDARLQFAPVRAQGVPPLMFYPWLTSLRHAKQFLWTGDPLSGSDAAELGLVNMSVPAEDLEEETRRFVKRLALAPSELVTLSKRALHQALDVAGFSTAVTTGVAYDVLAHQSKPAREFSRIAGEEGLRAAVSWRDAPYEEEEA